MTFISHMLNFVILKKGIHLVESAKTTQTQYKNTKNNRDSPQKTSSNSE